MRPVMLILAAIVIGTGPGLAQISVLVTSREAQDMRQLLLDAQQAFREARQSLKGRSPSDSDRIQLRRRAASLWTQARQIQKNAEDGLPLTLDERDQLRGDLEQIRKICRWFKRGGAAPPAVTPSPSPSPRR